MKKKLRKVISLVLTVSMVMTCAMVVSIPAASATTVNTSTSFSEDFEGYTASTNAGNVVAQLWAHDWFVADETQMYTTKSASAFPYNSLTSFAQVVNLDGSRCLLIGTPNQSTNFNNYGLGRAFPGVAADGAASGIYEIQFDFKPYATQTAPVQFLFTMNTADGSAANKTVAQHNILAAYQNYLYMGYRNYLTLYNNNVTQGKMYGNDTGGMTWYTVKAVVDCDARYYSVELYNRGTGALVARRSPVSFDANESIGFLKLSALGMGNAHRVYVDNISMEKKETKDLTIYNETFDSFDPTSTYQASTGMTTGSGTEVVTGNSYFEGFTPWRYNSDIGKAYMFGTMSVGNQSSQVVRLGGGTASGLVYKQVGEDLVTQTTQPLRGLFKTSFKFKPANIQDDVTVNVIPSESTNIANNNACAVFKLASNNSTPYLITADGHQALNPESWYQADLYFDVVNQQLTTQVRDTSNNTLTFVKTVSGMTAVRAIMFNVPSTSAIYMDDVVLAYCSASDVPTPAVPTEAPTEAPTEPPVEHVNIDSVQIGGTVVDELSDITANSSIDVAVDYSSNDGISGIAMIAFYKGNKFFTLLPNTLTLDPNTSGTATYTFTAPNMSGVTKALVLLWDSFETIMPYCEAVAFE